MYKFTIEEKTQKINFVDLKQKWSKQKYDSQKISDLIFLTSADKHFSLNKEQKTFLEHELQLSKALADRINQSKLTRTQIAKKVNITTNTLWKLESEPLSLNDNFKKHIRKKIYNIL